MYTYERLCKLCSEDSNDSDIAHFLLNNLDDLNRLTIKDVISSVGVSKASLHRFYHKGGYTSFKDLVTTLNQEIKLKKRFSVGYEQYKENMKACIDETIFNDKQIRLFIEKIRNAKHVVFYGNTWEISCFKRLFFYLFTNHIDVVLLDRWNLEEVYGQCEKLSAMDVFVMVETTWRIQGIYENSMITKHIVNLETVHDYPFFKFYIGEANCEQYRDFYNIGVPYKYDYVPYISLNLLDEKILALL